jgi:hypothetical protein
MKEYILEVKDLEGEVLELKTFAYNIMQVIDSMVAFNNIEAIKTITRVDDGYTWKLGQSITPLREMRESINDETLIQNLFKNED